MNTTVRAAAVAAAALAFATAAVAQQNGPPPQQRPPQRAPQPLSPQPAVTASFEGRSGSFTGIVDTGKGELCYLLNAAGIEGASTARIITDKGQPAVTLQAPVGGASGTCATIGADTAKALLDHPERYWLEIGNATYPQAALAPLHAQTWG